MPRDQPADVLLELGGCPKDEEEIGHNVYTTKCSWRGQDQHEQDGERWSEVGPPAGQGQPHSEPAESKDIGGETDSDPNHSSEIPKSSEQSAHEWLAGTC